MSRSHVHGRPDNEAENLEDILGRGPGDGDLYDYGHKLPTGGRWIGIDKPDIEHPDTSLEDWISKHSSSWYNQDNNAASPLEADRSDVNE